MAKMVEITFEAPVEEIAVLDGYRASTGETRTAVYRQILREWSDRKKHMAVSICRVAGVNPMASGSDPGGFGALPNRPENREEDS